MNTENERAPAKPTGRQYVSVDALMGAEGVSQEVQAKVAQLESETRIVQHLAKLRQKAGITQEQMAELLGVTQGTISKLENSLDADLTLGQIRGYSKATGFSIGLRVGKPLSHFEAVKVHAEGIKTHLEALADLANRHDEIEKEVQAFFGQAFFNILSIMAQCNEQLPNAAGEFEMVILKQDQPLVVRNGRCAQIAASIA